jgi:hypothetical protein
VGFVSRARRREKAEGELDHLEARFCERLIAALRACAAGQWGLFGQHDGAGARAFGRNAFRLRPSAVSELLVLGDEIDALRSSLGFPDGNAMYASLKSYRRMRKESAPDEPRLAQQFLAEIAAVPEAGTAPA